jgi:ABC-type oligopeptide transport system substrate-binding subunit
MSARRHGAGRAGGAALISATVVLTAALVSCARQDGNPGSSGSNPPAVILVRGVGPDPDSLDPQKVRGAEAQSIVRDLCEGLTTLDPHADAAPGVARSWSMSADGRTWTFTLRPEARWPRILWRACSGW